ncbi:MAG: hypothetical protein K9H84_04335, partial [Bacteroidales bacterium]|nr:hypothetical protein [Bacteroidales bacterium]
KTEVPKKCVVLSIVVYFCGKKQNYKKEQGRYCYLPALNFLSDNSDLKYNCKCLRILHLIIWTSQR